MACPDLIITDGTTTVTVPLDGVFKVGQTYAPSVDIEKDTVSSNASVTRNLEGELVVQEACGEQEPDVPPDPNDPDYIATQAEIETTLRKQKTTINIAGRYPLNIHALSRSAAWTIHCICPVNDWPRAARAETYVSPTGTGKYPIITAKPENGYPSGGMNPDGSFSWTIVAVET